MNTQGFPYRVLIVDDVPSVREALRWVFDETPELVVVGEAEDGQAALHQVNALTPDIVLLDIELPVMDGFAVAQAIKALPTPPSIIFLTLHTDPVVKRRALSAGGDAFVEKGAGWSVLIEVIRQLLGIQDTP